MLLSVFFRKFIVVMLLIFAVVVLSAEIMIPIDKHAILRENIIDTRKVKESDNLREVPPYEFMVQPTDITANYYDFMPGSYNGTPIRVQPDASGGICLVFHGRETSDATRRVYYAYIDSSGNINNFGTIGNQDSHEGYPGIDIDPVTGNPITSWHINSDSYGDLEVVASYDLAHISQGSWITPFDVITDDVSSPNGTADEFIWPYVHIGPSPITGKRRVYLQAGNTYSPYDPSPNPIIAYADFDVNDFNTQSTLEWTYLTIPIFDDWNQSNPEWIRPFHSFDVSKVDGRVAFLGYNTNNEIYVCYNDNYAEGSWTYSSMSADIDTYVSRNLLETK